MPLYSLIIRIISNIEYITYDSIRTDIAQTAEIIKGNNQSANISNQANSILSNHVKHG